MDDLSTNSADVLNCHPNVKRCMFVSREQREFPQKQRLVQPIAQPSGEITQL
jgi:hypothetical protein